MTSRIAAPGLALAALVTAVVGLAAWALAPDARASVSDRPCATDHLIYKKNLRAKVNGRSALLGKVYVFDEGKQLCAVTTSAGTLFAGVAKKMSVTLTVGGKSDKDSGRFSSYAGRVRLKDTGKCISVRGSVKLDSGAHDEAYETCSPWHNKPQP
jgi:hypothetical protein